MKHSHQYHNGTIRPYEPILMTALRILDALLGIFLFLIVFLYFQTSPPNIWEASILIFTLTIILFHLAGIYRSWRFSSLEQEFQQIFYGFFVLYASLLLLAYFFKIGDEFSRRAVIGWMMAWPLALAMERILIRITLRHYRVRGHNVKKAVIAGNGNVGEELARLIDANPWSGAMLFGFFDDEAEEPIAGFPVLGKLDTLPDYVRKEKIDIVYLTLPSREEHRIKKLLEDLSDTTASIFFIPDIFYLDLIMGGSLVYFDYFPVIALRDTPIRGIHMVLKRLEDLILASLILLAMAPLFVIIPVILKLTSRGPVFFKQWRYGLNGQPIEIYKFRTMNVCEDGYQFTQAKKNDDRITSFGSFLRRTSLDEIPQLINVIQGRMSLVGPRPHPVAMNEEYRKLVPGYMLRHKVKPGITGLAQVNGFRGETDHLDKMEKRVKYDLEYLRQWSLFLDVKILLKTVFNGVWKKGAY